MTGSDRTPLAQLSAFLLRPEGAQIHYRLTRVRDGAIMVQVTVPGERWEIEFFADRATEIEIFRSDGSIEGADFLDRLFADHGG